MPTSPSPRRGTKTAPPPAPRLWPRFAIIAILAGIGIACAALPASVAARFLPAGVHAEDFSGSVWHGSAGRITVQGRDAGAVEWHLHPLALLRLHVAAYLHWVKGGFVLDGEVDAADRALSASQVEGGGPLADLSDFGLASGWRGSAGIHIRELAADLSTPAALTSAVGEISVADVSSPQVASGANLGGYSLSFADSAIGPDGAASAALTDTGGPLSVNATVTLSLKARSGLFSGSVQERADAPAALHRELENIGQLHARDAAGRIPVELEFTF
jgi:hypothetical protein